MKHPIKTLMAVLICFLFSLNARAQAYEPAIVILSPHEVSADKKLSKELDKFSDMLRQQQESEQQRYEQESNDERENFRIMSQKRKEFSKNLDFFSSIPMIAESYLQYKFVERFKDLMIYAVPEKSVGTITSLSAIAEKHKVQYVVNFLKANAGFERSSKRLTLVVQLYDNLTKQFVLEKEYTGADTNPGLEFTCKDGSLECTVNNALSKSLDDIIRIVTANNPSLIREKQLAGARQVELFTTYYTKPPDAEIVNIIEKNYPDIPVNGFYHGFMDDTRSKFIGFFAVNSTATSLKDLQNKKGDQNVQIISSDITNVAKMPSIYANVVVGINYKSKWYISKQHVTYFEADDLDAGRKAFFNNLQRWGFFKENTTEFNPDFWEASSFEKVPDITKDPDWEKYKDSIWKSREIGDRPYIGLYRIVANELRKTDMGEAQKFERTYGEEVMRPFFDQLKSDRTNGVSDYALMDKKFKLIFPKDRTVVLCPIAIQSINGKKLVRYFVSFPGKPEIYEWTYFKPVQPEFSNYGGVVVDQLGTITTWNFNITTVDDQKFWNNYVTKMDNGNYVYLKRVK